METVKDWVRTYPLRAALATLLALAVIAAAAVAGYSASHSTPQQAKAPRTFTAPTSTNGASKACKTAIAHLATFTTGHTYTATRKSKALTSQFSKLNQTYTKTCDTTRRAAFYNTTLRTWYDLTPPARPQGPTAHPSGTKTITRPTSEPTFTVVPETKRK